MGDWLRICPQLDSRKLEERRKKLRPEDMANTALRPGGNPGANLESISCRCYVREVAFEWELTKETIYLPLGCP